MFIHVHALRVSFCASKGFDAPFTNCFEAQLRPDEARLKNHTFNNGAGFRTTPEGYPSNIPTFHIVPPKKSQKGSYRVIDCNRSLLQTEILDLL